jgi:flagellar assembly protein FliH
MRARYKWESAVKNSSKTHRFTEAELESLRLWSMPDVSGVEARESETVELDDEPTPILTVDEIEAMQKQAYDEAFAQGKMHGFQQGFDEGSKKGYEDNLHLLQSQAATMVSLLTSLSEPFKRLDDEVEKELVKLAIAIATQMIRREIKLDPGQIVAVVRESISVLPLASQKISLKLHPEDAELVRSALALDEMSASWTLVEDPLITRGGCEVDTDISHVNATVEHRLAAVIATLLGGERESDCKTAADSIDALESEPKATVLRTENAGPHTEQLPVAPTAGDLGEAETVAEDSSL